MRKHASSWIIKVTLGAIIVSFIFFFGYSSYQKGSRAGRVGTTGQAVAKVGNIPISESEFKYFFDRNFERMKANFKDKEIPDFARKMTESMTLNQLVGRELALQQADELGLTIPDDELANTIKTALTDEKGEFDPIAYRHQYLPNFKSRSGMDYEIFVRQDLRLAALQNLFGNVDRAPEEADKPKEASGWTFESVVIDPNALVQAKTVKDAKEAEAIAQILISSNKTDWKKLVAPYKIEIKKVGPIKVSDRKQLLDGVGKFEDYETVFKLTNEHPILDKPIQTGGKLYVVKLVKREKTDAAPAPLAGDFFQEWMQKLLAKTKVQSFLDKEQ